MRGFLFHFMKFVLKKIKAGIDELLFLVNKHKFQFKPVFIIGCGRSGTTILGQTLAQHSDIHYLNERRDLWHKAYPQFNIWSSDNNRKKLVADKSDHKSAQTDCLRRLFFKEQVLSKKSILLEKLPINSFRMDFLTAAFPDAKFIYLHRNGLEVCRSIEKAIEKGNWHGKNKLKYKLLESYARSKHLDFIDEIKSSKEQAMLEWRLSIESSDSSFKNLSQESYTSLSYYDFTKAFDSSISSVLDFLCLSYSKKLILKWSKEIKANDSQEHIDNTFLKTIGGPFLEMSMQNTYYPKGK